MTVESIVEKTSKKGSKYFLVVVDGEQVVTWSNSILELKGKPLPPDWKIIEKTDDQGRIQKQLIHEGEQQKGFQGKRFSAKSPEEIVKQESSMHYAFAKDLVVALITQGIIKNATDAEKFYLSFAEDSLAQANKQPITKEEKIPEPF
jgi:hypothetical protein